MIKPTLQMKQEFLVRVLADKRFHRRGKVTLDDGRRVALSAFDGAVLACVVHHVNVDRGYSFVGSRTVAELTGCAVSSAAKSIDKLKALKILITVNGSKKNKAQRLTPNWDAYPEVAVHSHEVETTVHSHEVETTVHSHEGTPLSTPIGVDRKGRKATLKGAKGTSGAARVARASLPSGRSAAPRGAPATDAAAIDVDDVMALRAERNNGGDK